MADIIVDTKKLEWYAERLAAVNSRVKKLDQRIDALYAKVGLLGLWNLMQEDAMTGSSGRLTQCQSFLRQTATDFESAERKIVDLDISKFQAPSVGEPVFKVSGGDSDILRDLTLLGMKNLIYMPGAFGVGIAEGVISLVTGEGWKTFWNGGYGNSGSVWSKTSENGENFFSVLTGGYSAAGEIKYGEYKDDKKLGDEDHLDWNVKQTESKDPKKQVNPDEKFYDTKGTIVEGKAEAKIEGSVLHAHAQGRNDWAQGSVDANVLTGEAHANAAIGMYVYEKDKDGNVTRIFSPGVSAEVGASVAAVQVEAEGRIGLGEDNNMLGVYGNVDAKALTAEAKAKIAANRNEVYAGASAEADLVKVSGTAGVSVLGTDVGVSGSLKIGVGAHAEVGYTDGKVKVDIGAAVGVGFDLGFEVDVSGTVDAVCDAASNAWESVTNAWNSIF